MTVYVFVFIVPMYVRVKDNNGQYWFVWEQLPGVTHCHCHCEPLQSHCAKSCHGQVVMAAVVMA